MKYFFNILPTLLVGAKMTIQLTAVSVLFGTIIGLFVGIARVSRNRLIRWLATAYVEVIRGTPLLVQLYIVYFGLVNVLDLGQYWSAILAFSINSGGYVAEIVRGGIQSIDKGQMEAARSLGMTYGQAMRYIILPQAVKRILPPLGNEFIILMKDSSLVSIIALEELTRKGQIILTRNYKAFETYGAVAIVYLVMTLALSQLVRYMERRLETA